MMTFNFTGRNAIVIGAGSGIGKAIAMQLADNGANVWVADIVNAKTTAAEMQERFGHLYNIKYGFSTCDVADEVSVKKLFEDVKVALKEINIVVNSAGIFMPKPMLEATSDEIIKHLDVNLMGIVYGCRQALETMITQGKGGKILNVLSVGSRQGEAKSPYYTLGKSAGLNWSQSVALFGAPHGIICNAICPGTVRTPMWDVILEAESNGDPAVKDELFNKIVAERTPIGRAQTVEEMAYAAAFFCSDFAEAIVGQALNIDGGWYLS